MQMHTHSDSFASAAASPLAMPDERRTGRRHRTVLLIGKVAHAGGDAACLVHDISRNGLKARFTIAPAIGERLRIEVRGLPEVAATVRWVEGYKGGVEFDFEQDLTRVFHIRDDDGLVARSPRFAMRASATLRLGGPPIAVDLVDISAGGAKLACDTVADVGQAAGIVLPELADPVFGSICWVREERIGFRFATPLPLSTLSQILGCG